MVDNDVIEISATERWIELDQLIDKLNVLMENALRKRAERTNQPPPAVTDWLRNFPGSR